jgi:hypothetical protein
MKNIFIALALISATSFVQAEESTELIKKAVAAVTFDIESSFDENEETKVGCAICPAKEENRCSICGGHKPKSHESDVDVEGQEDGDEVKCGCKPSNRPN